MASNFGHIYLEEAAADYPLTAEICANFPAAQRINIRNYRHFFNRPNQDYNLQKGGLKLILAVKRDDLLYRGSPECQDFNSANFYYNTPLVNCVYDCEYCYLQGKYQSANLLVFVNQDDLMAAVTGQIPRRPDAERPLLLALSYDTDLLAVDNRIPIFKPWVEFARTSENLLVEIRTKSSAVAGLKSIASGKNILLSWTVSPQRIIDSIEHFTPALDRRIQAIGVAIEQGWQVRLSIDPVIYSEDWPQLYLAMIERLFTRLPASAIHDIQFGPFRINENYYRRLRRARPRSLILMQPLVVQDGIVSWPSAQQAELRKRISDQLSRYLPDEKIHPWQI